MESIAISEKNKTEQVQHRPAAKDIYEYLDKIISLQKRITDIKYQT